MPLRIKREVASGDIDRAREHSRTTGCADGLSQNTSAHWRCQDRQLHLFRTHSSDVSSHAPP